MILVSAAVVLAAVLLAGAWMVEQRRQERCLQGRVRSSVIVTLTTGPTFSGVLYESDATSLVLVQAVEASENVPVDGELLLRWADVAYVQKP